MNKHSQTHKFPMVTSYLRLFSFNDWLGLGVAMFATLLKGGLLDFPFFAREKYPGQYSTFIVWLFYNPHFFASPQVKIDIWLDRRFRQRSKVSSALTKFSLATS